MSESANIVVNVVEIRHKEGRLQFQYAAPTDYLGGTAVDANGVQHHFYLQVGEMEAWAECYPGIRVGKTTIALPPVDLSHVFDNPGYRFKQVGLGAVCSAHDLFEQTRAAGAEGTIFVKEDVADALAEQAGEDYDDLSDEERAAFVKEHWTKFTSGIDDILASRGNDHISTMITMALDEALDEFQAAPKLSV